MPIDPLAGKPAPANILIDVSRLKNDYFDRKPDTANPAQLVSFGTSGHRGTSLNGSFTEAHILSITQAICEYRHSKNINGPLFMGKDTHALSEVAQQTALEVLAANQIDTIIQETTLGNRGFTPTPVISHAILTYNRDHAPAPSDGIVITPSHNPPEDGGCKYNPPDGGPADTDVTNWIERAANTFLEKDLNGLRRISYDRARRADVVHAEDFITPYVAELASVVDLPAIAASKV